MHKRYSAVAVLVLLIQLAVVPVQALEIVVDRTGDTYLYADQVLGKEKEEETHGEEHKEEPKEERKEKPLKIVPQTTQKQIRIKTNQSETEVRFDKQAERAAAKTGKNTDRKKETGEIIKTERVEVELPAELREKKLQEKAEERRVRTPEPEEVEASPHPSSTPEPRDAEEIREERRERRDEILEIRTQRDAEGKAEIEFESRLVKAKAKGAEFVVDPETRNVTVITPSGQEHVLTHLPDQAIVQLQASGVVNTDALTEGEGELRIETKEDGSVVYRTTVKKPKRILGLFKREVESEVELDDSTGEVTETEVEANSLVGRFLNALAR